MLNASARLYRRIRIPHLVMVIICALSVATANGQRSDAIRFNGGYVEYGYNYRSNLDTPYAEKNIGQHQILSSINISLFRSIPIRVSSFIRRSNSALFRNITDVQVSFDAAAYRTGILSKVRDSLLRRSPSPDSLVGKLYKLRQLQHLSLGQWLHDPMNAQKLIEANEILKVPKMTYNAKDNDSTNGRREDSLRTIARAFVDLYNATKGRYDSVGSEADSLRKKYAMAIGNSRRYDQLVKEGFSKGGGSYDQWSRDLDQYGAAPPVLPPGLRWLLDVRTLGLGKNTVNTSELTARNVSLNGVNFVYNSWYYLGLAAGVVDYRFRDFVIKPQHSSPQYMYVVRAGLGRLEHNYFILSAFGGRKQTLATTINSSVVFSGLGAETRWQVLRNTYITAEVAQSFSTASRIDGSSYKTGWHWDDRSNKALSLKLYSWWPGAGTRVEAQYKFLGANYQSFNAFQPNSELRAWYVKGEKSFFHRQLTLVASLRTNDYSSPYIAQNYQANTVFKSLSLSFHRRGLPIVSIGYLPMSQLTKVGDQFSESRFQTLNASLSHFYKIGLRQASTTVVYTKFYNGSADTAFIYYKADNIYISHSMFFSDFTSSMAFTHSTSPGYVLDAVEGSVNFQCWMVLSLGCGAKLNSLNRTDARPGGFFSSSVMTGRSGDQLSVRVEKSYLPGSGKAAKLVPDVIGNISFMKVF